MLFRRNAEKQAGRENQAEQGIRIVRQKFRMEDYLYNRVPSNSSLLIDGYGKARQMTLDCWLRQLYEDEDVREHPIIVVSKDSRLAEEMLNDMDVLQGTRDFILINHENRDYDLLLGLSHTSASTILRSYASQKNMNITGWEVFTGVFHLLEKYNYETSLLNLHKVFKLPASKLAELLEVSGCSLAAQECRREDSREKDQIGQVLESMVLNFEPILNMSNEGCSITERVKIAEKEQKDMPFLYFSLEDRMISDFLEYLQSELREISSFHPLLVIDSVALQQGQEQTHFLEYILNSQKLSLTLTAESCFSLFPVGIEGFFERLDAKYHFLMIFFHSANEVEKLTRARVGTYSRRQIAEHTGLQKGFFDILPKGTADGWAEMITEKVRVSGEDVRSLLKWQCLIVEKDGGIYKYTNIDF